MVTRLLYRRKDANMYSLFLPCEKPSVNNVQKRGILSVNRRQAPGKRFETAFRVPALCLHDGRNRPVS